MRRAALILTTLFIAAGTLAGAVIEPGDSPGTDTTCGRDTTISLTDFRRTEFYRCVDRRFNTRFPYRETLRHTKAWVDYYVFRSSPVQDVHIGRDGWLIYRGELPDYQKSACGQEQVARDLARSLHDIEKVVEASGRRFVFIVAPNKSTIYPEYVGVSRGDGCEKSLYDVLLEAFGEYPVSGFLRLDQLLREAKAHHQVYFKTDTHWNQVGALVAARAILDEFPPVPWRTSLDEVQMRPDTCSGVLARMMRLDVREPVPHAQMKAYQFVEVQENPSPSLNISHVRVRPVATAGTTLLPRAVFYRDSFMITPLEFIQGAFEQTDAYWVEGGPILLPTVGSEQALRASKIILVEVVEWNLKYLTIDVDAFHRALNSPSGGEPSGKMGDNIERDGRWDRRRQETEKRYFECMHVGSSQ